MSFLTAVKSFFSSPRKDTLDDIPHFHRILQHEYATHYVLTTQPIFTTMVVAEREYGFKSTRKEIVGTLETEFLGIQISKQKQTRDVVDVNKIKKYYLDLTPEMEAAQQEIASQLKGKLIQFSKKYNGKLLEKDLDKKIQVTPLIVEMKTSFIITWSKPNTSMTLL